jgi:methionine aminopeptidase
VTLYHGGFHGDLNETYYIGEKALADPDAIRIVETSRECLDKAIELVKPGMLFRDPGNVIEKHAKTQKCSVIKTYCGHGINQLFHCAPNVPHYAKNKAVGEAKPGMCFTIEPMISLGTHRDKTWPDDWTSVTADGTRTAQFGKLSWRSSPCYVANVRYRAHIAGNRRRRGNPHCEVARLAWRPCSTHRGIERYSGSSIANVSCVANKSM